MLGRMIIATAMLTSASLAVLISQAPAPPEPKIEKFASSISLMFTPGSKEMTIVRSDVEWPTVERRLKGDREFDEAVGDNTDVEASFGTRFAAAELK